MSEPRSFVHVQGLSDLWLEILDEAYMVFVEFQYKNEIRETMSYVVHHSLEQARMEVAQIQRESISDYEAGFVPLQDILNIEIRKFKGNPDIH